MKNIFLKINILVLASILPFFVFAQVGGGANLENSDDLVITQSGNQYLSTTTLQLTGLNSVNGLTLLGIVDSDEINPPFQTMVLPMLYNNGYIDINITTSYNPDGYFFQFFLVDTQSLNSSGGPNAFNPANNSQYQTFLPTTIVHDVPDGGQGGNGGNGGGVNGGNNGGGGVNGGNNGGGDLGGGIDNSEASPASGATNFQVNYTITNPLTIGNPAGANFDLLTFLQKLFSNFVKLALPFLIIFMVYSGFLFVEAQGNEEKLSKAKTNFKYVIIGAVLILGAWTIALILKGTVDQLQAFNMINNFINLV